MDATPLVDRCGERTCARGPSVAHGHQRDLAIIVAGAERDADLEIVGGQRRGDEIAPLDQRDRIAVEQLLQAEIEDFEAPAAEVKAQAGRKGGKTDA